MSHVMSHVMSCQITTMSSPPEFLVSVLCTKEPYTRRALEKERFGEATNGWQVMVAESR